ncbi:uncharacterized protein Z518_00406 [Rhinocladiella mackenziei CBS 650.93]|uniref:DUF6594 domain-containing protein n=1 Tax=Rhinocladiella mackenziei CBS 650.93 TaxID=1442369 RepID=A0A0D2G3W4_9EURO|nr:uncharacterized protein Z518_00406 [Rhinocladiella mackenziei CBS 650.93]KIX09327.1 hypothetical protein Z518_00406 [Rhinocladiella mackenziei CBS 650.93]
MTGYDELATLIGSYPELAIFRRFGHLSAKVLLYAFALQMNEVSKIRSPEPRNLESLRKWLASEEGGNHFLAQAGVEAKAWDAESSEDLMAFRYLDDRFAQWIMNVVIPAYHRRIGHWIHQKRERDDLGDLWHYKEGPFMVIGDILCTFLSSLRPSCCIFVLYTVQKALTRFVLITCLSLAFSLVMTFVVQARRQDVFAATTALAAVQVVLVGGADVINIGTKQD